MSLFFDPDLYVSETTNPNQLRVKVSTVSPPIELEFSPQEFLLIKRFRSELQRVGVRFVIGSDCESSEPRVIVHELPSAFVDREVSETRRRRPSVAVSIVKVKMIYNLLYINSYWHFSGHRQETKWIRLEARLSA
jgi:hypothetical protein